MKAHQIKPSANAIAYSYLRFSSPEQAKGDSVRRQIEMTRSWCERNKVKYDESLSLRDEGISAFTGAHRTNTDRHALAGFLKLVEQKKVPKGSYFIIENLDRLTREDTVPAVNLFTSILLSGVRIVQLDPENIYTDKSDSMDVMRAVLEMSRGHSESANKSRRMSAVWGEKRKRAAEQKAVLSRSCPAWIKVEGKGSAAKYVLIPARAEVVRRIFRMATEGNGARLIVKALVEDEVPPFARKPWSVSYAKMILASRQTFGEFTPRTGRGSLRDRKPTGSAIANYYPAAITSEQFFAAQAAITSRRGKAGRPGKEFVNVFANIIWDARTQGRLHLMQYIHKKEKQRYLTPYAASRGESKQPVFALDVIESALFNFLDGIDPREVLPDVEGKNDTVALETQEKDIVARLARLKSRLKTEDEAETVLDAIRELEADLRKVSEKLSEARQREAAPTEAAWGEFKSIAAALAVAPNPDAARLNLRGVLQRMVDSIWCLFLPDGKGPRVAHVQVVFAGGEKFHHFTIVYRPKYVTNTKPAKVYPGQFVVRELATTKKVGDIRVEKNARALEAALAAVEPAVWVEIVPGHNQAAIRSKAYRQRLDANAVRTEKWRKMRAAGKSYAAIANAEVPPVSTNTVHVALNGRTRR